MRHRRITLIALLTGYLKKVDHNSQNRLYPFTRRQIEIAAGKAGFHSCQVIGGYKGQKPGSDDFARLFILVKYWLRNPL